MLAVGSVFVFVMAVEEGDTTEACDGWDGGKVVASFGIVVFERQSAAAAAMPGRAVPRRDSPWSRTGELAIVAR
jgi:hypothetical protein